jgi:hypothetical protein
MFVVGLSAVSAFFELICNLDHLVVGMLSSNCIYSIKVMNLADVVQRILLVFVQCMKVIY